MHQLQIFQRLLVLGVTLVLTACGSTRAPYTVLPNTEVRQGSLSRNALKEIAVQVLNNMGAHTVIERLLATELEKQFSSANIFGSDLRNGYRLQVEFTDSDDGPLLLNVFNAFVPASVTGESLKLTARFDLLDSHDSIVHSESITSTGKSGRFGGVARIGEINRAITTDMASRFAISLAAKFGANRALVNTTPQSEAVAALVREQPRRKETEPVFGNYYALIIGNNSYSSLPALETAIADARSVESTLAGSYGFQTRLLLDSSRAQIFTALHELRKSLTGNDNLLIYYAGHGFLDESTNEGYWLPVDAEQQSTTNWISNASLTSAIRAMDAKHVLIVADSCFSGQLTRDGGTEVRSPSHMKRMARLRARTALTSGGLEPVLDSGGDAGHSVFATAFLDTLEQNGSVVDTSTLFSRIRRSVALEADQIPEYGDIRRAGHKGGDFVFVPVRRPE